MTSLFLKYIHLVEWFKLDIDEFDENEEEAGEWFEELDELADVVTEPDEDTVSNIGEWHEVFPFKLCILYF